MLKKFENKGIFGLFYLILAIINGFFVIKYGLRFKPLFPVICIGAVLIGCQLILIVLSFKIFRLTGKINNWIYWAAVFLFFVFTIFVNNRVDGQTLQVDRWSAMHVGITALLNGDYPYTAIDHLGGRTSNLPGLLLLGIPFYLMGDVGYLQSFTFLLFALFIFNLFQKKTIRFAVLLLLVSSPCYLYEIYVKSDLVSNFILVLLFGTLTFKRSKEKVPNYSFWSGALGSLVLYTRLTAIIPLILVFFKGFIRWPLLQKFQLLAGGILTLVLLTWIVFIPYPSISILLEKNPFVLQNRQLPLWLSLIFILLPCFFAFQIQDIKRLFGFCVILLALPVFTSLILYMIHFGFWPAIRDSRFDLSYFNIITPFLFVYLGSILDEMYEIRQNELGLLSPSAI